jgi:serine/threonine-protein kinase
MSFPAVIGRYEIIDQLGQGAMGSVFRARDPVVGRIVALKTIHSAALAGAQSEEYRARFYREARASGALSHPGIVPVFDVGDYEGTPFLVMEFVEGRTLAAAMKKGERFRLDSVCEIGQQIATALGYAHRQGVIHRDIKPANILMTSREVYGIERPRITDFGIAKLAASEITTTGQLLGTPAFMPPEQFTGAPIDGRADLFSLGVILYLLATGEQPFPGESMTSVSYKVVYTDPIPAAKLNPAIPTALDRVILKCLAKSPTDRYQTGDEIAQDLTAIRANAGTTVLRSEAPLIFAAGGDTDMTLAATPVPAPYQPSQLAAPAVAQKSATAPVTKKNSAGKFVWVYASFAAILLAAAAGGWILIHQRYQPAPPPKQASSVAVSQPVVPAPQQAPATVPPSAADQTTPTSVTPATATLPAADQTKAPSPTLASGVKPSAAKQSSTKQLAAKAAAAPVVAPPPTPVATAPTPQPAVPAPQPPAPPAATSFNPRSLDPKTNARLKIELSHLPDHVPYTVFMNGKVYLRGTTGDGAKLDDLYVPPGVQEFRVSLKSGELEKSSNTVSDEFKATKRKTLKLELRGQQNTPTATPTAFNPDAQIFLSIKSTFGLPLY